jgi:hypothetical protein
MEITVTEAKGVIGNTNGGVKEVKKELKLTVPDGATVASTWEEAKRAIGLTPKVAPIINRQEIGAIGSTKMVSGDYTLQPDDIFNLVFV